MLQCSCSWHANETSHSSLHFVLYCTELSKVNKSAAIMWERFNDSELFSQITWHVYTRLPSTRVNCVDLRHTNNCKRYLILCNMWPNTATSAATIVRNAVWTVAFVAVDTGLRDSRLAERWKCRPWSSGLWYRVVWYAVVATNQNTRCQNPEDHKPNFNRPQQRTKLHNGITTMYILTLTTTHQAIQSRQNIFQTFVFGNQLLNYKI